MTEPVPDRPSSEPRIETEPFATRLTLVGWTSPRATEGRDRAYLCIAPHEGVADVETLMPMFADSLGVDPRGVLHDAGRDLCVGLVGSRIGVLHRSRLVIGTYSKSRAWIEAARAARHVHLALGFQTLGADETIRDYAARVVAVGDCALTTVPVKVA
ncbi:MAG: hypothetical protein ACRDXX_05000 [Stackebrandtia sp.]